MKFLIPLLLGGTLCFPLQGREVDFRLWISGGMQGVVMGNAQCPGWLAVSKQLKDEDPDACWIQVGAPPLPEPLAGLKVPDAVIPREIDFRLQGRAALEAMPYAWSVLNLDMLPQFPDQLVGFPRVQRWKQVDGVEVLVFSLLSEQAPLRIPADRIRPLQVTPALKSIRAYLSEHPLAENEFPVLVLPEDANASDWSTWLPEIPLLVQPAGGMVKVIEVQEGKQLRVQAGKYGRSVVRVQVYWDTVSRRFRSPTAEGVWVYPRELLGVDIPESLLPRLHPVSEEQDIQVGEALLAYGDAVLLPFQKRIAIDSRFPDALRLAAVPVDQAWMKVQIPRRVWTQWKQLPGYEVFEVEHLPETLELLITAETAAGGGEWMSPIRQFLLTEDFSKIWMPFTTRDLIWTAQELP
ncbi:hypothetical protein P3T73_14610 [Kiritimatiellota bacterium B12222]|nr:hypothetical protein P3T73_14610 [Kiritimatiellota bacterium B12222]